MAGNAPLLPGGGQRETPKEDKKRKENCATHMLTTNTETWVEGRPGDDDERKVIPPPQTSNAERNPNSEKARKAPKNAIAEPKSRSHLVPISDVTHDAKTEHPAENEAELLNRNLNHQDGHENCSAATFSSSHVEIDFPHSKAPLLSDLSAGILPIDQQQRQTAVGPTDAILPPAQRPFIQNPSASSDRKPTECLQARHARDAELDVSISMQTFASEPNVTVHELVSPYSPMDIPADITPSTLPTLLPETLLWNVPADLVDPAPYCELDPVGSRQTLSGNGADARGSRQSPRRDAFRIIFPDQKSMDPDPDPLKDGKPRSGCAVMEELAGSEAGDQGEVAAAYGVRQSAAESRHDLTGKRKRTGSSQSPTDAVPRQSLSTSAVCSATLPSCSPHLNRRRLVHCVLSPWVLRLSSALARNEYERNGGFISLHVTEDASDDFVKQRLCRRLGVLVHPDLVQVRKAVQLPADEHATTPDVAPDLQPILHGSMKSGMETGTSPGPTDVPLKKLRVAKGGVSKRPAEERMDKEGNEEEEEEEEKEERAEGEREQEEEEEQKEEEEEKEKEEDEAKKARKGSGGGDEAIGQAPEEAEEETDEERKKREAEADPAVNDADCLRFLSKEVIYVDFNMPLVLDAALRMVLLQGWRPDALCGTPSSFQYLAAAAAAAATTARQQPQHQHHFRQDMDVDNSSETQQPNGNEGGNRIGNEISHHDSRPVNNNVVGSDVIGGAIGLPTDQQIPYHRGGRPKDATHEDAVNFGLDENVKLSLTLTPPGPRDGAADKPSGVENIKGFADGQSRKGVSLTPSAYDELTLRKKVIDSLDPSSASSGSRSETDPRTGVCEDVRSSSAAAPLDPAVLASISPDPNLNALGLAGGHFPEVAAYLASGATSLGDLGGGNLGAGGISSTGTSMRDGGLGSSRGADHAHAVIAGATGPPLDPGLLAPAAANVAVGMKANVVKTETGADGYAGYFHNGFASAVACAGAFFSHDAPTGDVRGNGHGGAGGFDRVGTRDGGHYEGNSWTFGLPEGPYGNDYHINNEHRVNNDHRINSSGILSGASGGGRRRHGRSGGGTSMSDDGGPTTSGGGLNSELWDPPSVLGYRQRKSRSRWTLAEVEALVEGIETFDLSWAMITKNFEQRLRGRSQVQLKDKWRNLKNAVYSEFVSVRGDPLTPDLENRIRILVASQDLNVVPMASDLMNMGGAP